MNDTKVSVEEHFERASKNYERLIGGCTRDIARHVLTLSPPITAGSVILDNGCGPGIITDEIMKSLTPGVVPPTIEAVDLSPSMIQLARQNADQEKWNNVKLAVMDAQELTFLDGVFSHSFSNFVVFFAPNGIKAVSHLFRTLEVGGTAILTTWDSIGYLPAITKVYSEIKPDLPPFKMPFSEAWFTTSHLEDVMRRAGFKNFTITQQHTSFQGVDIDDLVEIFSEMFALVTKDWSDPERHMWRIKLKEAFSTDMHVFQTRSGRTGIRMIANVAVAIK